MKIHAPALALGLSLLGNVALMPAFADTAAAPAPVSSDAAAKETSPELKVELKMDAKADAILHKVSDFYAGLKSFATTMEREGKNGKESHKATYKVSVEKPNKISIEISGGAKRFDGGQAKMNGEKLFLYNPVFGYVSSPATSNYEDLIRDHEFQFATAFALHGQNLLEALLTENPYDFMQNHYGIKGAELVGEEK
ncbi:MAG: DUF2092 domain-containing protein, partial [Cyanobacteria bacterium REEB67]|nr:DUF2092 domain-containing protein [Cyanobacteria bacterium REEB67]